MKRQFLIVTELKRARGRISFYIGEIVPDKGLKLIDNDFTCSITSNRGIDHEAVNLLVKKAYLAPEYLTQSGYIDWEKKDYNLITIEGQGLNYIRSTY